MYAPSSSWKSTTVVNDASGQRSKRSVVVFDRGRCESARSLLPVEIKRVTSLVDAPAAVVARLDQVGEFPQVLAIVSHPQAAGLGVDGHPPRIAVSERPDFAPRPFYVQKRVVGRNRVLHSRGWMIDVDSQNLAEQIACVLSGEVVVGVGGAVAGGDVQHAVVAKHGGAAVVPLGRPFQNAFLAGRVADRFAVVIIFLATRYDKARQDVDARPPSGCVLLHTNIWPFSR